MAKTIIANFSDKGAAKLAIQDLLDYGFRNDEISIISDRDGIYYEEEESRGRVIMESTATGIVLGTLTGGILGFLLGIGVLTIAGAISLLANLPIISNLGLVGVQATTVAGALYGALLGAISGSIFGSLALRQEESYTSDTSEKETATIALPITSKQEYEVKDIINEAGAANIKILDLAPYEEEEQYKEYYGTYSLAGTKGGKTRKNKKLQEKSPQDKGYDEF